MKTQDQILQRIKSTYASDPHGNATLYLFLDRSHQIEVLGSRMASHVQSCAFHEQLTEADVAPMLELLKNGADERVMRINEERASALRWLVA